MIKGGLMKRLLVVNIALIVVCSLGADVRIGADELDLAFEHETLSQTDKVMSLASKQAILSQADKVLIAEDIQHTLSTATIGKMKLEPYNDAKKQSNGIEGCVNVVDGGHLWPSAFWRSDFGDYCINEKTAKKELIVPKKLVDAYREAIELKNNHRDAFACLHVFLDKLNDGYYPEKMTFKEKKELFWFPRGSPAWSEEKYYDKNLRETQAVTFNYPSLLSFQEAEIEGRTVLYCKPVIKRKKDGSIYQVILVYDENRWLIGPS